MLDYLNQSGSSFLRFIFIQFGLIKTEAWRAVYKKVYFWLYVRGGSTSSPYSNIEKRIERRTGRPQACAVRNILRELLGLGYTLKDAIRVAAEYYQIKERSAKWIYYNKKDE